MDRRSEGEQVQPVGPAVRRAARAGRRRGRNPAQSVLVVLAFLLSIQAPPRAVQVGQVVAVAWPPQVGMAASLADIADHESEWPGLGRRSAGPLRLILVPDRARYDRITGGRGPAWGAGIALPGARTILIRADQGDLTTTLRHELAHIVLHDAVRVRLPRWFDEGYASFAAGEWDRLAALSLNLSVARGVPE